MFELSMYTVSKLQNNVSHEVEGGSSYVSNKTMHRGEWWGMPRSNEEMFGRVVCYRICICTVR